MSGARKESRRREDREMGHFVDRYSVRSVFVLVSVLILSLADATLTLKLISLGTAREFNPVMDFFLEMGALPFLLVKYALTCGSVLTAMILKNHTIIGGRVSVKSMMGFVMVAYIGLIIYELALLHIF